MTPIVLIPISSRFRSQLPKPITKRLAEWEAAADGFNGRLGLLVDSVADVRKSTLTETEVTAEIQTGGLRREASALAVLEGELRTRAVELIAALQPFAQGAVSEAATIVAKVREAVRGDLVKAGVEPGGLNAGLIFNSRMKEAAALLTEARAVGSQFGAWLEANRVAQQKLDDQLERLRKAALAGVV